MFEKLPFLQGHNGHTLCSSCNARALNKCLSCVKQLGNIRCLALEKMAMSLELHCKYEEFGCPEIIPYYAKCKHEDSCNFRPYSCPCSGWECSVVGDIPFLVSHLTDYHKADMINGCEFKCRFLIADVGEEETCTWMVKVSKNITLR